MEDVFRPTVRHILQVGFLGPRTKQSYLQLDPHGLEVVYLGIYIIFLECV